MGSIGFDTYNLEYNFNLNDEDGNKIVYELVMLINRVYKLRGL